MVLLCLHAPAQDVTSIIQKSVEANNRDWDADPDYDYVERDRDAHGSKTYEVTMILGSPYERLIEVNGRKLNAEQAAEQQKKCESTVSERRAESSQKRAERIAKFEQDRKRDHALLAQLTKAFNFTLLGKRRLDGRPVYVLKATPRPGYHAPDRDTQVLPGMEWKLWIDTSTFQWVKVEAHVIRPIAIEGFLAEVEPGTQFELEKTPVDKNVWLTKHFAMKSSAKVLHIVPHHSQEDDTYFNYHKAR
jgi:hypothetical protein